MSINKLLILLIALLTWSCINKSDIRSTKIKKSNVIVLNQSDTNQSSHDNCDLKNLETIDTDLSEFNPINQNYYSSIYSLNNNDMVFVELGSFFSRDSFSINGYKTNKSKTERIHFTEKFSISDINNSNLEKKLNGNFELNYPLIYENKNDTIGTTYKVVEFQNIQKLSEADGKLVVYRGEFEYDDKVFRFVTQTDPVPLIIVGIGLVAASFTAGLVLSAETVENYEGFKSCEERSKNDGFTPILAPTNHWFGPKYRFEHCCESCS